MQMTRELKKRFGAVEERIGKLEKRKPTQQTNGEDLGNGSPEDMKERLENIEAVLQIPGEALDGDVQVLSAWRQIVESKLQNIETVLVMPGGSGFLSGFAAKVDQVLTNLKERVLKVEHRGSWTPDEGKTLDARVKTLWDRPSAESFKVFINAIDGRVQVLQKAVEEIQLTPDPSKTILEFDDRLSKLEKKKLPTPVWMKGIEERVIKLEEIPDQRHTVSYQTKKLLDYNDRLIKLEQIPDPSSENPTVRQLESVKSRLRVSEAQGHKVLGHGHSLKDHQDRLIKLEEIVTSDFPIRVFGKPFTEWIKDTGDRIEELERKPVAGTLSNIAQDMNLEIEGNTRMIKALLSQVRRTTGWFWILSGVLGITFLLFALSFYLT